MSTVRVRLRDAYPGAIASSDVIEPVLKAALSGRWLTPNENIGGQNVEKMQLVQLQYNKERTHRRLLMPYIWIHLAVTQCPFSATLGFDGLHCHWEGTRPRWP